MKTESGQDRPASAEATAARRETVEVVKRNWRAEVETARVYRELAGREPDEKRKGILLRMAEAEERHAQRWAEKLADLRANSDDSRLVRATFTTMVGPCARN